MQNGRSPYQLTQSPIKALTVVLVLLFACTIQAAEIEPDRAAAAIDDGALVLDVRSADEVAETGVLAEAEHVPHTDIQGLIEAIGPDHDRLVVLYCRTGFRTALAIGELHEAGYTNLINAGGYVDLEAALDDS
jgi:phage shock protein E